jgi:hypothetical protein
MRVIFRITRKMLDDVKRDLSRPHPVALERIGFIYVRPGTISEGHLLLATGYQPVRDEHYVESKTGHSACAIINRYAITEAMQRSLNSREGVFHVHMHDVGVHFAFSTVDLKSLNCLMPSFYNINQKVLHGALLITRKGVIGKYWTPDKRSHNLTRISVIGYPCSYHEVSTYDL